MMRQLRHISTLTASFQRGSVLVNFRSSRLLLRCCPQQVVATSRPRSTMQSSSNDVPNFEYQYIEGVERLERYLPGGYYPVLTGDMLCDRYRVIHKMGYGKFSTVWLARDERRASYVAVKISTADSQSREADVLRAIGGQSSSHADHLGRGMIPIIKDQFEIPGPNGRHQCYVIAPARSSVAAAISSRLFKLEVVRALVAQLVLAVAYIHAQGFVHGDIHLGNALVRLPWSFDQLSTEQFYKRFGEPCTEPVVRLDHKPLPSGVPSYGAVPAWLGKKANEIELAEARLLLSDFGEAYSPSQQKRRGDECRSPLPVSPPEAYFEPEKPLPFPSDIWTLACAIWSILGPRALFDGTLATQGDIVSQQVDVLGPLPQRWWDGWETRNEYFDETGRPKEGRFVVPSLKNCFQQEIQALRQKDGMGEFDREETAAILAMLRPMFAFRPEERATAEEVLCSDWMVRLGLPEFKKIPK